MFRTAMLFALSQSHKIGLAVFGGVFIVFSLICAMVIPRYSPNFPGRWRNVFVIVCIGFFGAMIAAVLVFGKEPKPTEAATQTTPATAPGASSGDPVAGKMVYTSSPCGSCHTFTPAGSTGKIGPDLDHLADYAKKANQPIASFTEVAITHPPAPYVPPGFPTNAMPPNGGATLTAKNLADLIAFLVKGP
jgi:cytochrome c5